MSRRLSVGLVIVALVALTGRIFVVSAETKRQPTPSVSHDNTGMISAPIVYKDLMLIAVTTDGVAAIAFGEEIEHGAKYRYRCLRKGWANEVIGEGSVFEKYTDGQYDGGNLWIEAGAVRIGWSTRDAGHGWVYYEPEKMRLQIANAKRFETYEDPPVGNAVLSTRVEKLDLRRFLKQL